MDRVRPAHRSSARSNGGPVGKSVAAAPAGGPTVRVRQRQTRRGSVVRQEMLARFTAIASEVELVLVVAPAGYGKTTALDQWAKADERPAGWIQLDETDNDPVTLVRDIAVAAADAHGLNHQLAPVLAAVEKAGEAAAVPELIKFLRTMDEPALLVFDDLDCIRRSAALDVVVSVAANLPAGWQVAAAGQRRSRLRVARLRSQGRLVEFGPKDLAFNAHEARELLGELGVDLPDPGVRAVLAHTEGWPAGVYLAALSMAGQPDPSAAADEITGDDRYIVDYFRDEILARASGDTVRFLLRTSVLDHFCGSLCDAVLETSGSAARLRDIEALNLFTVPQDDHGEWYRYHRLFAEMLQSELRRREPREELRILSRASDWYDTHDLPEQAITCAIAAGDQPRAARLIAVHTQRLNRAGKMTKLRRWLEAVGEDTIRAYPPLAVMATWIWAFTGDAPRARWSLRVAESGSFEGPLPDGSVSLESAVLRARAALAPYGIDAMRADGRRAIELEPPGSEWHSTAATLYGCACALAGDRDQAVEHLERAAGLGRDIAAPGSSMALAERALLAADEGDWATAAACADDARRLVDSANLQTSVASLPTYLATARVAVHRGNTQAAVADVAAAQRLFRQPSPAALPWLAAQSAIVLGRLLLDLGDLRAAEVKATEAGRFLAVLMDAGVLHDQRRHLLDDLRQARTRTGAVRAANLTAAELRILPLLQTHLSLGEISDELIVSRNTVKSQVAAIYRKLDVTKRTEAVQKAQDIGLLPV